MMNPEMASPEMIAPNMAVPAPAEPVAAARSTRRDLGMLAHSPVVVELFTSQGCSSCPPADDMLAGLADRPDVLALSWHVDYWDYLGWADEFAKPEFTTRQKQYARAAGERSIYTPQILIGGTDTLIDLRPAELMAMINNQLARPVALSVTAQDMGNAYQIELTPRAQMKRGVAILLVRYAPCARSRSNPARTTVWCSATAISSSASTRSRHGTARCLCGSRSRMRPPRGRAIPPIPAMRSSRSRSAARAWPRAPFWRRSSSTERLN
ncbi:DUF1223 domain-containing protein [Paracoccus cavernae]|uniref:DUF1223 domain-containing protein n=1 Tax=Paracoccus cavernae TaxID=1571207 RepID=A0ABT8D5F6_9RHOB|nr:DUF1223 domain-containing protein [Paracoccus cavernae]